MVKEAAIETAGNVEWIRKQIGVSSLVDNRINLDALKLRHAKLRDKMGDMDESPDQ